MTDILALLQCLDPYVASTTIRQMSHIITAILSMTGRVTMLNISRWAEKGGSYRSIQRWFYTVIPWALAFWLFFRQHLFNPQDTYLLVGDGVTVTKAGQDTHGVDRFFSSIYGKPVPGLAFFALSLVSVEERRSYPVMMEQIIRTEEEKAAAKAKKQAAANKKRKAPKSKKKVSSQAKRKPGRPKGSKNKDKTQVKLTSELGLIKTMIQKLLMIINGTLSLTYLVLDGQFGNNNALQMSLQCGLQLISKLRHDAALYFPHDGPPKKIGPPQKYGDQIDYNHIPDQYLKTEFAEDDIQTRIYQMTMLHKEFAQSLNVVIIVKTNLKTQARAHVVLFSNDLKLAYESLIDYYTLRFQIEFDFRDAKQYWGLEDFMNIKQTPVTNAANLSLFMVNVSRLLLRQFRQFRPHAGVLDLKAHFHGCRYVSETLKLLPDFPDPILMNLMFEAISQLGSIHPAEPYSSPP
jgi:putative transposase